MMLAAIIIVIGQGAIIGALLTFVHTFGAYTEALKQAHQSNMLVYRQALKILEYAQDYPQPPRQEHIA